MPSRSIAVGIGLLVTVGVVGLLVLLILHRTVAYVRMMTACPAVDRLRNADARAEALAALTRGDRHLLMLGGYVGTVPGGENVDLPSVMLEGTGDDVSEACQRIRPYAERYATIYNQTIVSRLEQ